MVHSLITFWSAFLKLFMNNTKQHEQQRKCKYDITLTRMLVYVFTFVLYSSAVGLYII